MKNLLFILYIVIGQNLSAQLIRVEIGGGFLINSQDGTIYYQSTAHTTPWYDQIDIERKLWQATASMQVFVPLNFGTQSFERFSYGIQTGIAYGKSSMGRSYDQMYVQQKNVPAYRIPLLFMLRTGSTNALNEKKVGLAFGGGIEFISLSFADEYGKFVVPIVQIGFGIKRSTTSLIIFPKEITSTYLNNGIESKRLSNKLFEFRFSLAIECTSKRYRRTIGSKWS